MFASTQVMSALVKTTRKPVMSHELKDCPAIHEAIGKGDHDALESIIANHSAGVLDQRRSNGNSPLHTAVACIKADCLKTLIQHGAPLNSVNAQGMTALHLALQFEHTGAALTLIAAGADCSMVDREGHTPLYYAMCTDNPIIVQVLMEKGVGLTATDIAYANTMQNSEILIILKRNQVFRDIYHCLLGCLRQYAEDQEMAVTAGSVSYEVSSLHPTIFIEYFQNICHQLGMQQILAVPVFAEEAQEERLTLEERKLQKKCDAICRLIMALPVQHQEKGFQEFIEFLKTKAAAKDHDTAEYLARAVIGHPSTTNFFKLQFVLPMTEILEAQLELGDDCESIEHVSVSPEPSEFEGSYEEERRTPSYIMTTPL